MENSLFQSKKLYLFVIALILAISVLLVAAKDTRATLQTGMAELARIKDSMFPANARPPEPSRLEELEQIKDDVLPVNAHPSQPNYPDGSVTNHQ